jgi:hypothetical protein
MCAIKVRAIIIVLLKNKSKREDDFAADIFTNLDVCLPYTVVFSFVFSIFVKI